MEWGLLDFNSSTSCCELLLDFVSFSLGNTGLEALRSALNQVLSFLEAKTCECTDFLDNVKLLVAASLEDDFEFCLSFSCRSSSASSSSNCNRSSSRNAEDFLEFFNELSSLNQCKALDVLNKLLFSDSRHVYNLQLKDGLI